jgi:hypothetical protein
MALLDTNSGGLHAVDMITLRTNMIQYYVQAKGIPQYIVMMEDAQKKAKREGMPIANVELVMMASAAVLAAQHFPHKVRDWEGRPAIDCTWRAWKVEFCQAHIRRQRQLQASGGGKPLARANTVLPAPPGTIDCLGTALDNLALAAANNTTVRQQLTAANLALTATNAGLTAANKKLSEALAKLQATKPVTPGTPLTSNKPFPGITVGLTAIVSACFTQVPHAAARPRVTRTRQRHPTRWEGARRTRDGTHVAPDGVGWQI